MTVEAIIAAAIAAIDSVLKLIASVGQQLSEEDLAKLKIGVIDAINERTNRIASDEDREWSIVRGSGNGTDTD